MKTKNLIIIGVIIPLVTCEMESRLVSIEATSEIIANVGDKIAINVTHTPSSAVVPAYRFASNNKFIASVDDKGIVVCNHVGTCEIRIGTADARFSTVCMVTVLPLSDLFHEPTLDFNRNKTSVKMTETNRTIVCEKTTLLLYQDYEEPVLQVMYQFDDNQKLITSAVKLLANVYSELTEFLSERYDLYPFAERKDLQIWRGQNVEVVVKIFGNDCFVVYNPFSGNSTIEHADKTIETFVHEALPS